MKIESRGAGAMTETNIGGISSKLGNGYEAKWLVRQLLDVVSGKAQSLRYEGITAPFVGFEAAIQRQNVTEWHQTKINAPRKNWTVAALKREGVLSAFARRLTASTTDRCVFVSQDPAHHARKMSEKASQANDVNEFISLLSKEELKAYHELKEIWKIDDNATMQGWLRRCSFRTIDIAEIDSHVETIGSWLFYRKQVFGVLRVYLEERFNKLLTTELVHQELRDYDGVEFKHWQLDPTLIERINAETDGYLDGHGVLDCRGHRIERRETKALVNLISQDSGSAVVLLSGVAGSGKSGVVCNLIEVLRGQGIHHLVFRVDHHLDKSSSQELGFALTGRQESPAVTLKGLSSDKMAILIVDQVDAVSDVAGRSGAAKEAVRSLSREIEALGSIKLVLVCRTFDLGSDKRFKQLKQDDRVAKLEVQLLDWSTEVEPLLTGLHVDVNALTASQRELLRLPLNLGLFLELRGEGGSFASRSDLFEALLKHKDRAIRQPPRACPWSIYKPLGAAADYMSNCQRLDCPDTILDDYVGAFDVLSSEHLIISTSDRKFGFFHESLFDYLCARQFSRQSQSLHDLLTSSEQHLFWRTQVRQILEALRQSDRLRYLRELREVLQSEQIRYHVKHAIALWLATLTDPTREELQIVTKLDDGGKRLPQLMRLALLGASAWFDVLHQDGWIERELTRGSVDRLNVVLHWLTTLIVERPTEIVGLLQAWWGGTPGRGQVLLRWLGFMRGNAGGEAITELCEALIRSGNCEVPLGNHNLILRNAVGWGPTQGARILRALSDSWFDAHPEQHPFERDAIRDIDLYSLEEFARKYPIEFLEGAAPMLLRSIELINAREKAGHRDPTFSWLRPDTDSYGADKLIVLYRISLRRVAADAPDDAKRFLAAFDPQLHRVLLHFHLETIAASSGTLASALMPLLDLEVTEAGLEGAEWKSFADAVRVSLPHLSTSDRSHVEEFILAMQPEIQRAVEIAHFIKKYGPDRYRRPKSVIRQLNQSGEDRWAILETIGADLLSPRAIAVLEEGRRKFQGSPVMTPTEISFGWTQSPIAQDQTVKMSDDNWLRAMEKYAADDGRRLHDLKKGGANELGYELQNLTKTDPARFTGLLARIPETANPTYIDYILWGLAEATEADTALLAEAIRHANGRSERHHDEAIVRLFDRRPLLAADPTMLNLLLWIGEHGAADEAEAVDSSAKEKELLTIDDLLSQSSRLRLRGFNGARGAAAEALAKVIWNIPSAVEPVWDFLERRIAEETLVSVRCCLVHPLLPLFNSDKARCAVALERLIEKKSISVKAEVEEDVMIAPLATHAATRLLPYIIKEVPEVGQRLLQHLVKSSNETFRLIGAWHVFRASYSDASYASLADELALRGVKEQRLAASVAANAAVHDEFRDRAEQQLIRYFDDEDRDVRAQAAGVFREISAQDFCEYRPLAKAYVDSKAFDVESWSFLHLLENGIGDVHDLVVDAAIRIMVDLKQNSSELGQRTLELHNVQDLIRRDYAATENDAQQRARLLDVIDTMLAGDYYGSETIVKDHDR